MMETADHRAKGPFIIFSLGDRYLFRRRSGIVRCASFLKGMALAVVFGSMVALSAPAFALGGGGGGGAAPAPKITKVAGPVSRFGERTLATGDPTNEFDYASAYIEFVTSSSQVTEGDTLKLRVRVDGDRTLTEPVTVELSALFGSRSGADVNFPDSLTFTPGETGKDLELVIVDDAQPEHIEAVVLTLRGHLPEGVYFGAYTHTITIADNDGAGDGVTEIGDIADDGVGARVGFATSASEAEKGGSVILRVQLSKPLTQPVTVSVVQQAKEFIPISDSLTFVPGETSKVLEIEISEDWIHPGARYVLEGVNFPEGVVFGQRVHRVKFTNHSYPDSSIADEEIVEAEVGFATSSSQVTEGDSLLLHFRLSKPLPRDLVQFALAPVGDVVISSRYPDVVFRAGKTSAVLEVTAVDDEQVEGMETVTFTLGGAKDYLPDGVIFGRRTHTITIIDNDSDGGDQTTEGETSGTTITSTAETDIEIFPVLHRTTWQRSDGEWVGAWSADGTEIVTNAITSGTVDGGSVGVHISQTGEGALEFVNDAKIDNVEYAIQLTGDGSGDYSVTNNSKIMDVVHGIDARRSGTGQLKIGVGHEGWLGLVDYFPSSFVHPMQRSEITASQRGVFAQHSGTGRLVVEVEEVGKVVSKEGDAVVAEHKNEGRVSAYIEGEVKGARTGVVAKQSGKGDVENVYNYDVEVYVRPGGKVHGDVAGIIAEGEDVLVDLAGTVTVGSDGDGVAVNMRGANRNSLLLRPGFSSDGKIVVNGEASSKYLGLYGHHYLQRHPTERIGYLDLSALRGFDVFRMEDDWSSIWRVTGSMGSGEAFRTASVGRYATLRFTDAVFKMAEWVRRDGFTVTDRHGVSWEEVTLRDEWCSGCSWSSWGRGLGTFELTSAALEIVGANTIRGNLSNQDDGSGNRPYSPIQSRYPHLDLKDMDEAWASFIVFDSVGRGDRLTVTGDYRGRGFLIFDVGLNGWDEHDKLVIEGSTMRPHFRYEGDVGLRTNSRVLIGTPEEGTPSLGEESPVLIEVRGGSDADAFFGAQDVGAFHYVLEHETFGEIAPNFESMRKGVISEYYYGLINKANDDYHKVYDVTSSQEKLRRLLEIRNNAIAEARRVLAEASAGRVLGGAHRTLDEALANLPTIDDFDGYRTWRFRRKGPSSLAINSAALASILSKSGEPLEKPSGSHKKRDGSDLGFRADTREYAGGIWGQRQDLRASQDLGVIADGSSRMSGERIHFGYDTPAMSLMGGDMIVGANIWHGNSASGVSSSIGTGDIDVKSQAAALTASWWSPEGLYVSGQTQYVRFLSDISADGLSLVKDNEGVGMNTSAELGYRFAVPLGGMDFEVAPQAQLVWSHVDFENFTGRQGELVSLEDGDLVTGRLGLSWDGEWRGAEGLGQFYGGMSMRGAVDGKTSVNISGVSVANEHKGLSLDGKLGLSYEWNEGYAVHGEASAMHHDDVDEVRADLGVRIDF